MPDSWKKELSRAVTSASRAWQHAGRKTIPEGLEKIARDFAVRIPEYYLDLINPEDPRDPIALQCLPSLEEGQEMPSDLEDAVGDRLQSPVPGLVVKHSNRVILLAANTCTMYCRFCFRRPVASGHTVSGLKDGLNKAFLWIDEHKEVQEVILSGGDPLTLNDDVIEALLTRLRAIPHIRLLRIHTRVPVTLPTRITPELSRMLRAHKPLYVVTHFNHPRELTLAAEKGLARLNDEGLPLLNQSVLLKDVNDSPQTLADLSWRLLENALTPYYLHHCDRTPGTGSFRISISRGRAIMRTLKKRIPGHGLPRYVLDLPNGMGKADLEAAVEITTSDSNPRWKLSAPNGRQMVFDEKTGAISFL